MYLNSSLSDFKVSFSHSTTLLSVSDSCVRTAALASSSYLSFPQDGGVGCRQEFFFVKTIPY